MVQKYYDQRCKAIEEAPSPSTSPRMTAILFHGVRNQSIDELLSAITVFLIKRYLLPVLRVGRKAKPYIVEVLVGWIMIQSANQRTRHMEAMVRNYFYGPDDDE